ncbi:MAG: hypothetical protein ACTJLM_01530 [Ehrlichia sp.]
MRFIAFLETVCYSKFLELRIQELTDKYNEICKQVNDIVKEDELGKRLEALLKEIKSYKKEYDKILQDSYETGCINKDYIERIVSRIVYVCGVYDEESRDSMRNIMKLATVCSSACDSKTMKFKEEDGLFVFNVKPAGLNYVANAVVRAIIVTGCLDTCIDLILSHVLNSRTEYLKMMESYTQSRSVKRDELHKKRSDYRISLKEYLQRYGVRLVDDNPKLDVSLAQQVDPGVTSNSIVI